jgi:hypothetical protein
MSKYKVGDKVEVYGYPAPDWNGFGTVEWIDDSRESVAVAFDRSPTRFSHFRGTFDHRYVRRTYDLPGVTFDE